MKPGFLKGARLVEKPAAVGPTPKRGLDTSKMSLDYHAYPHLVELVLFHAPREVVHAFRGTSKEFRNKADAILNSHLTLFRVERGPVITSEDGVHYVVRPRDHRQAHPPVAYMELPHPGGQIRIDVPPRIHIQGNNHTLRLPSFYVPDPLERRGRDYRNYRFTAEDERRLSYARSVDLSAEIGLQCGLERVCEVINRNSKKLHTVRLLPDPSGRVSTIIPINARTLVVFGAINRLAILQQSQPEHVAALNITPPPSVERVVYNFNSFHGISRFFLPEIDIKEGSAVRDAVICCWGWDGPPMWESNMDGDELEIARERWDDLRMLVARLRGINVRVTFVDLHIIPPIYWGYSGTNTSTNVDEVHGDTPDKVDIEQVLRDTLVTKTNPRPINKNSNRARKKIPKSNLYEQKGELRFITSDEYKAELERNGEPESWMLHTTQIIEAKTPGYVDPTVATEKVYPSQEAAQSMFPNFNFAAFNA